MGTLIYGNDTVKIDLDDRLLAHLQIVIVAKLRRNEPFPFTWRDAADADRRSTIWMHAAVPLLFSYLGSDVPPINREWLEALTASSNTAAGLRIIDEPTV